MVKPADLPDKPICPRCGAYTIGMLKVEEDKVFPLIDKKGQSLTRNEERLKQHAIRASQLIAKYGKPAVIALSARRVEPSEIGDFLSKKHTVDDEFYELVLNAERKAMSKRFS